MIPPTLKLPSPSGRDLTVTISLERKNDAFDLATQQSEKIILTD
jgi:hypothetical protein